MTTTSTLGPVDKQVYRRGGACPARIANIVEEIETLDRNEKRGLRSRISVPFLRLLKFHVVTDVYISHIGVTNAMVKQAA